MRLTEDAIQQLDRKKRLKLMNSITGVKPCNLVGTIDEKGQSNVAIFSSAIHLGSDPALIGLVSRPTTVPRHTYENIVSTKEYTLNMVQEGFFENAHYTSAKFEKSVSEFRRCGLTEEYEEECLAPFVKESSLKIALRLVEVLPIRSNGCHLLIGRVVLVKTEKDLSLRDDAIDLDYSHAVGVGGLNDYYALQHIGSFPYARPDETPDFHG